MTGPDAANDDSDAEHIAFEEFRNGLPHGRFRVIVNPELAQRFVARRVNVVPIAIAVVGCGIASALAGWKPASMLRANPRHGCTAASGRP